MQRHIAVRAKHLRRLGNYNVKIYYCFACSVIRSIAYNQTNNTIILVWHPRIYNNGLSVSMLDPKKIKKVGES